MTTRRAIEVECDFCCKVSESFSTVKNTRAWARHHGWRKRTFHGLRVDICPECLDKERRGQKLTPWWLADSA